MLWKTFSNNEPLKFSIMNTCIKKAFIALLPIIICNQLLAQSDSIDVFIKNEMQKRGIPGLQLAIVKEGEIIKTGNYGLANVQDSIPVSDKSVFPINSLTKAFTGVAILQLVEEGKMKLSAPVSDYLDHLPASWKPVTIQQLLSHTSGIPDIVDEEESTVIFSWENAWEKVQELPVEFKPGEKFRYNQTNYVILGKIIDKLSQMPFKDFIIKEQLQKTGMNKTIESGFGATRDIVTNSAGGYRYANRKLVNMFFAFPPYLQTAAGMSSTATELALWIIALQNQQILKQKTSLTALWKPALLNNGKTAGFNNLLNGYAAGWPVIVRAEHPAAASVGGGRSAMFVYPGDDMAIVVLTNLSGGSPEAFIDELAGFYIPDMKEANGFGLSPSLKKLKAGLDKAGYKNAVELVKQYTKPGTGFTLTESEVNSFGYKLLNQNKMADALEIFKLNVHLFPASANAFDSLGEIYAEMGNNEQAIKNYEQSLKLNPQNKHAEEQINKLNERK